MKSKKMRRGLSFAGAFFVLLAARPAGANTLILRDGNSTVQIDPSSQAGMFGWNVNGANLMPQQWYWFRTGGMTSEQSIDTMQLVSATTDNPLFGDPGPDRALLSYSTLGLTLDMQILLVDGEPTRSLSQVLTWTNTSSALLTLAIFQYSNFLLSSGSDQAVITGNHTALVTGAGYTAEIVATPFDGRLFGFEAAAVPFTISSLNNGTITNFNSSLASASGNTSAAFEWVVGVPTNGSFQLSIDESLTVPEPGSAVLMMGTLGALFWIRRRTCS